VRRAARPGEPGGAAQPPATHESVFARIHQRMESLSAAERRVARALLADYPAAGLTSSHALAADAGVSAPTVVRLALDLGFDGFSDLQEHLRAEVSEARSSPVARVLARGPMPHPETVLTTALGGRIEAIRHTMELTPESELLSTAALIAKCPAQVLVTGGFFSSSIARILALQLSQVRRNVLFLEEPLRRDAGVVLDAKKGSVLVIFDLRRYEPAAAQLAKLAHERGLDVVLLSDRWMSPVAALATTVLTVDVGAVPFDTFVALLAVSEAVVESVLAQTERDGIRRMSRWEASALGHYAMGHFWAENTASPVAD
jgi:DNA-binding MurR/RpiR family transcriptional regulator